jgi:nucleoside-triphosphatase THEP1
VNRSCAVSAVARQLKIERIAVFGKMQSQLRRHGTKIGFTGVDILHR